LSHPSRHGFDREDIAEPVSQHPGSKPNRLKDSRPLPVFDGLDAAAPAFRQLPPGDQLVRWFFDGCVMMFSSHHAETMAKSGLKVNANVCVKHAMRTPTEMISENFFRDDPQIAQRFADKDLSALPVRLAV
jgi:hypothetical protein